MSLRNFIRQTHLLIQQGLYETRKVARGGCERPLQLTRLEERMLFSASALAPVVAQIAEAGGSLFVDSAPAADPTAFHVPDQQLLDLVADSVLPSQTADQNGNAAADEQTLELVFLDSSISNVDQMISNLKSQNESDSSRTLEFVVLDSNKDGVAQITASLLRYNGVDGLHIVSHGEAGRVQLGSTVLSLDNLDRYRTAIRAWQYSMSDKADVLFYGCNLAASDDGQRLLSELSTLTSTDVAASEDLTGAAERGGDWNLEYQVGEVSTHVAFSTEFQQTWDEILATYTVTNTNNGGAGSLRQAILDANANPGIDTITFNIALNDVNHLYYRDNGVAGTFGAPVATTLADAAITDFDADYPAGTARSWYRITLGTTELDVTQAVIIDGSTQAGYDAAKGPIIEINAAAVSSGDGNGLSLTAGASTVRGLVINNSFDNAIEVDAASGGSSIVGNYLGTDVSGTQARANATGGAFGALAIKSNNVTVGGNSAADRNLISGNAGYGIEIYNSATGAVIQGNYIGTTATGSTSLGNANGGIYIDSGAASNTIGGSGANEGNIIASNGGDGIWLDINAGSGNQISGNSIYSNSGQGIDFGANGVTNNDNNDVDTGANRLQNFPVLLSAVTNGSQITIGGTLNSESNQSYLIEFFANSTNDIEGQRYLGSTTVTTPVGSPYTESFTATLTAAVAAGEYITATATDPGNNTSEFSATLQARGTAGLWISSVNNGAAGGETWDDNTTTQFGGPNLNLEPGITTGTFYAMEFDLDRFGAGVGNLNGLHYVSRVVTVGSANAVTLLPGDVLFSTAQNETLGGVSISSDDIALFRPTTAGNYSAGTFSILLQNAMAGNTTRDFALVETATVVGGVTLNAGDFLLTSASSTYDKDITLYQVTDVGSGTTAGTRSELIDGDSAGIGFSAKIFGLELVQTDATLGGTALVSGQLLLSLDANDTVGTNSLSVSTYDIFILTVTATGTGTSSGTAALLVQGSDIGLTAGGEEYDAIALLPVNNAPVLDTSRSPVPGSINEDAGAPAGAVGTLVSALVDFATPAGQVDNVTDIDSSPLLGIAVTAADTANGAWFYSINDGANWSPLGAVTGSAARLLAANAGTRLYFQPTANYNGTIASAITFRAWDQSSGTNGSTANTSTNGGASAFSAATDIAALIINPVNDAPGLSTSSSFAPGTEDVFNSAGTLVSNFASWATDVDTGALQGLAMTSVDNSNGAWEYTLDGTNWLAIGNVSTTSARLLPSDATARIRFVPNPDWNGITGLTLYRAWDQTSGTAGGLADVTVNGGTTAFSTGQSGSSLSVSAVNDAPVLDNTGTMTLGSVGENNTSATNISSLIATAGGDRITDVDSGAVEGIAITAINNGNGRWRYSTDGGFTYSDVGVVSATSALLLRATDVIAYTGDGFNGGTADITFRAWDQSSGTAGTGVDASVNGGTTAFSTVTETASITTTSINDAPLLDNSGTMTLTTITEDDTSNSGQTVASIVLSAGGDQITDVDSGAVEGIAITALISGNGSWEFSTDAGSTWNVIGSVANTSALMLRSNDLVRFVPDGMNATSGNFTFRAWDQTSGAFGTKVDASTNGGATAFSSNTEVAAIAVTAVNDAPVVTIVPAVYSATEQTNLFLQGTGISVGDVDAGLALINLTISVGTGTLTVNGGTTGISAGGPGNSVLIVGTLTQLNDLLAGNLGGTISYFNASDTPPVSTVFTVSSNDGGTSGAGGPQTGSDAAIISITAVNDEQSLTTFSGLTVSENSVGNVIDNTRLMTTDVDNTSNQLVYTVTAATGNGTLRVNGVALAVNGTFTQSDVNAGLLTYDHDGSETSLDGFSFSVDDGAGSVSSGTFNITITPVNDAAPTITSNGGGATAAINVAENSTAVTTVTATDADLPGQTLTYSIIGGADAARFTIDSNTGVLAFIAAPDYEAPADAGADNVYDVLVQVSDGAWMDTQSIAVTVTPVNDATPTITSNGGGATAAINVAENSTAVTTVSASDADLPAQTLTFSIIGGADAARFTIDSNTGVLVFVTAPDYETPADADADNVYDVLVRVSDGALTDTQAIAVTVMPVNDGAPTINSNGGGATAAINVAENSTAVITVTASDADVPAQALTFWISGGADAGLFAIDSNTGVLTLVSGRDRETHSDADLNGVYEVTVQVSDGILTDTQALSLTITDIDEFDTGPVTDADITANGVAENSANGTVVGIAALAADADATTNTILYSLDVSSGGRFAIDSSTGVVTVANGSLLDYESATSHNITIRATSADGSFSTQVFAINITNVNEGAVSPVTDTDLAANTVMENVVNGTIVGLTGLATDPDITDTVTYSLDIDAGGRFTIDANTGVVTVNGSIDREAAAGYNITVRATSSDTSTTTQNFTISIGDVDEFDAGAITDMDVTANAVNENAAAGTVVGVTASASDADATTNTIVYSLQNSDGGNFVIDTSTGVVTTAVALNRETLGASRNITVRAASADGSFTDQIFSIVINDVDEFDTGTVTDSNGVAETVAENATIGTAVGITAFASDADATTNAITYTLDNSGGGLFAIHPNTGIVTVNAALDCETAASHSIIIRATSADGSFSTQSMTIAVTDVNESGVTTISDNNAASNTVFENSGTGAVVGIIAFASDVDATTNGITYSLDNNAGGRFAIDAVNGVVTVADGTLLDFESATSHSIVVRATSADGSATVRGFTISLGDMNDSVPVIVANQQFSVSELASVGTAAGNVIAIDADGVGTLQSWTITGGNSDGVFTINSATGRITVADVTRLNFESTSSYTLTVTVSDGVAVSAPQTISIFVLDQNEAPVFAGAPGLSVTENSANGTVIGGVGATDQDAGDSRMYSIVSSGPVSPFAIDAVTGQIQVIDSSLLNFEAVTSVTLGIRVTDAAGLTDIQLITVFIIDVNESPTDLTLNGGVVAENLIGGTIVATVSGSDPDAGDLLNYALVNSGNGRFVIDANTGIIRVAIGAVLNFETASSHLVTVRTTDAAGMSYDESFTITVTDANDAPVATDDGFTALQLMTLRPVSGVLANDSDEDGQQLTAVLASGPSHGTVVLRADGTFSYLASGVFSGVDSFRYQVSDGTLSSNVVTVTINVLPSLSSGGNGNGSGGSGGSSGNSSDDDTSDSEDSNTHPGTSAAMPNATTAATSTGLSPSGTRSSNAAAENTEAVIDTTDESGTFDYITTMIFNPELFADESPVNSNGAGRSKAANVSRNLTALWNGSRIVMNPVDALVSGAFFAFHQIAEGRDPQSAADELARADTFIVGSTAVVSTSLSVGYVVWIIRGSSILSAFVSAMPAWQSFDPLPILQSFDNDKQKDEESLIGIATRKPGTPLLRK